jgi:hypothetical protein
MSKWVIIAIFSFAGLAGAQTQSGQQSSQQQTPAARPPSSEMREHMMEMRQERMAQMQQQQMREMQPEIDAMQRKISLLGSELLSVQDVNTRRALQTDMELWQQLLQMVQRHMQSMGMPGHMMPAPGMAPPAPKSPQQQSPQTPH